MDFFRRFRGRFGTGIVLLLLLTGCAHRRPSVSGVGVGADQSLRGQLASLAPTVELEEANRAAACAQDYPLELADQYRVIRPPLFHNFLVNLGFKRRGLCYHWAEDLSAQLLGLELTTLEVRWAISREGSYREHNAVVLTAVHQPFEEGIVLDAWRHSGRLFWARVSADRYPWVEAALAGEEQWVEAVLEVSEAAQGDPPSSRFGSAEADYGVGAEDDPRRRDGPFP